jgi:hypothetical protein
MGTVMSFRLVAELSRQSSHITFGKMGQESLAFGIFVVQTRVRCVIYPQSKPDAFLVTPSKKISFFEYLFSLRFYQRFLELFGNEQWTRLGPVDRAISNVSAHEF